MRLSDIVNKYSLHDARHLADLLPSGREFIDVTISSPPYWNIKDYGIKKQIGFGQTYSAYLSDIEEVFQSVYTATKSTGSLWLVTDTFKQDGELRLLPFDIADRLRATGWLLQDIIIWQKDRTLPWSHQGKLRNIFEYVSFYSKTRHFKYDLSAVRDISDLKDYWVRYPERYSPEGKTPSRTWAIPIPRQGIWGAAGNYVRHACPLPEELISRILLLTTTTGDVVLDPFAGSGAVLATAGAMGRRFVGTDLNRTYQKMFYANVLPRVITRHNAKSNGDIGGDADRLKFSSAILALRCLKFPKELIRLHKARFGAVPVRSLLVFPSRNRRSLTVICCFPLGKRVPKKFLDQARELADKRPLSKYGLQAHLFVANSSSALVRIIKHQARPAPRQLFIYTSGRFYEWKERLSAAAFYRATDDLFSVSPESTFPRIVSSIGLKISPVDPQRFFEATNGG